MPVATAAVGSWMQHMPDVTRSKWRCPPLNTGPCKILSFRMEGESEVGEWGKGVREGGKEESKGSRREQNTFATIKSNSLASRRIWAPMRFRRDSKQSEVFLGSPLWIKCIRYVFLREKRLKIQNTWLDFFLHLVTFVVAFLFCFFSFRAIKSPRSHCY